MPGVVPAHAANHWDLAIASHAENFPDVDHMIGDIRDLDVSRLPAAELFWASPECTNWSTARGRGRGVYAATDTEIPGLETETDAEAERSRALMEEVPEYLEAMILRGAPVLAGVVENVVEVRLWTHWHRWRARIEQLGYRTRLIALNSMHARGPRSPLAPQSRDRLYLAYWSGRLGRDPDWDKWLRPAAWCPRCDRTVAAVQAWKRPGTDMGRYRQQYTYRCPATSCRGRPVEPDFAPAWTAIDWSVPGQRIGDRARPLAAATLARISAGLRRYARPDTIDAAGPLLLPAGGTWRRTASPVTAPMPTRTTVETDAITVPPLLVPVEGRDRKTATTTTGPLRTQTTRSETALVCTPLITELRGGGSTSRPITQALATITAGGCHHALTVPTPPGTWKTRAALYTPDHNTTTRPGPESTTTGQNRPTPAVEDCLFRMLEPTEIQTGMAFTPTYTVLGTRRQRVRQLGNAVTPNTAEVLISALVECITGEPLETRNDLTTTSRTTTPTGQDTSHA